MKRYSLAKGLAGLLGLAVLVGTVACGGGGGGGGGGTPAPIGNPYGIGGSILQNPVVVYNSILSSSGYQDFLMNMAMYSQSGYNSIYGNQGYPVAFQGQLVITDGLYCNAPPGTYALTTTQAGTISGTSIGPMTLQATGPANLQIAVNYGIIENAGARVAFNMYVYVNGQYCPPYLQTL